MIERCLESNTTQFFDTEQVEAVGYGKRIYTGGNLGLRRHFGFADRNTTSGVDGIEKECLQIDL